MLGRHCCHLRDAAASVNNKYNPLSHEAAERHPSRTVVRCMPFQCHSDITRAAYGKRRAHVQGSEGAFFAASDTSNMARTAAHATRIRRSGGHGAFRWFLVVRACVLCVESVLSGDTASVVA
mmetsp:Transcript_14715/g.37393  ORF Transcript_14715/g.37393 Transcript_14715/m.37393 type:complete len:122 (+) Transcript_14715:964-1329(+)|eukprot:6026672-Prymnesium_polylepis.1